MKYLSIRIPRFLASRRSRTAARDAALMDSPDAGFRFDAMRDETLLASISDESARWMFDYWGPRRR